MCFKQRSSPLGWDNKLNLNKANCLAMLVRISGLLQVACLLPPGYKCIANICVTNVTNICFAFVGILLFLLVAFSDHLFFSVFNLLLISAWNSLCHAPNFDWSIRAAWHDLRSIIWHSESFDVFRNVLQNKWIFRQFADPTIVLNSPTFLSNSSFIINCSKCFRFCICKGEKN